MASTQAALLIVGASLAGLAITTLTNPELENLPGLVAIAMVSGFGAGVAFVAAMSEPTPRSRRLIGATLFVCATSRAIGFAARTTRDVGVGLDWLGRANPVVVNLLAAYLGFLVWARAYTPVHTQRREEPNHEPQVARTEDRRWRSRHGITPGLRARHDVHRSQAALGGVARAVLDAPGGSDGR
jgi:hypothetical protein